MLTCSVSRPELLDLFERGIATKLDLAYAGPQSVRIAQMVEDGTVQVGAIHTYVELYARMFVDAARASRGSGCRRRGDCVVPDRWFRILI
jgi:malonate decarboxylase alpha subunit